ncbi:MAG: glycine-rich domain-containing protein [Akkermansiaceae bacterium]
MNTTLWQNILDFPIDDPTSSKSFSQRLAMENSWSKEFTERVLLEYRKFLYLCCEANHQVSPSDEVDEAWHLHLCYTRSYWQELCKETLGRPIHHNPTQGGQQETEKFRATYQKTLASYAQVFGEAPPADIWPPVEVRFTRKNIQKINCTEHWVISKKKLLTIAAGMAMMFGLVGCTELFTMENTPMIFMFGFIFLITVLIIKLVKLGGGGGSGGGCGSSCDSGCSSCGGGCGD